MLLDGRAYTSPVVHRGLFNLDTLGDRTSQRAVVRAVCVLDNRVGIVEQQRDMRVRPPILLRSAAMRVALRPEPVGFVCPELPQLARPSDSASQGMLTR